MSGSPFGFSLEQHEETPGHAPRGRPLARQVLVTIVGVFTISAVATTALGLVVGPRMFRDRLAEASGIPETAKREIADLYALTTLAQTSVGLLTGLAIWTVFAVLTARSLARSVATMELAAELVAAGRFDFALHATQLGPEAEGFARSFNEMAARLHEVETTRRRLLGDLAHELRTPIATLDGYLEAFEDGMADPDPETLRMLRGQTRRLARLVKDVSAVSRAEEHLDPLVLEPTPPAELVDAAVHATTTAASARGLVIRAEVAPGLAPVSVDRERMGQVLTNLLDNAVRHARTTITVSVARIAADGLRIVVGDDGDGIRAESLPHVFERFYRSDTARDRGSGGSGIGLAIAKALVGAHGGRISVASDGPGTGATFTIILPAARPTP